MSKPSNEVKMRWKKANYVSYQINLRLDTDTELIEFVEAEKENGSQTTEIFRRALKKLKKECNITEENEGVENKARICELLLEVLKETRYGENVESLTYSKDKSEEEFVTIEYKQGGKSVARVTGDSGVATVRDILKIFD